jgi:hypothetical protein
VSTVFRLWRCGDSGHCPELPAASRGICAGFEVALAENERELCSAIVTDAGEPLPAPAEENARLHVYDVPGDRRIHIAGARYTAPDDDRGDALSIGHFPVEPHRISAGEDVGGKLRAFDCATKWHALFN